MSMKLIQQNALLHVMKSSDHDGEGMYTKRNFSNSLHERVELKVHITSSRSVQLQPILTLQHVADRVRST